MIKKLLKITGVLLALFAIIFGGVVFTESRDKAVVVKHVSNENLKTLRAGWQGVPVDEKGRFVNHEHPFLPKTIDLLKWQLGVNPFKEAKQNDTARLEVKDPAEFLQSERD